MTVLDIGTNFMGCFIDGERVKSNCPRRFIFCLLFKDGAGHQAFVGSTNVRSIPPKIIDPFDYSSIAFLQACSEKRSFKSLWGYTFAAVFLTFCFYIGGYPMKWCNETDLFFSVPSPDRRPDWIPASWLASCLLYHLQTVEINSFPISEAINHQERSSKALSLHLGRALYPSLSLINHSCGPSACLITARESYGVLIALKSIPTGGEITIDYMPAEHKLGLKRAKMFDEFYFFCNCTTCYSGFGTPDPEEVTILICPECKSQYPVKKKCPGCESLEGYRLFQRLDLREIKELEERAGRQDVDLEACTRILRDAQSVIQPPSKTLDRVQNLFCYACIYCYGMWTLEPWFLSDYLIFI
ncbi:unnamed protein product [Hymenolepis diminuta]|uniref:SET domain-containing protein n=1 Tax=Hymenolepis diminuta TaxID=6216 RepID=A0A3P7BK28_HYMDI|nr:unnamed protein product [Hymenolepis diminuta]